MWAPAAPLVGKRGWLMATPQGTGTPMGWNAKSCCGDPAKRGLDDVAFIGEVVKAVRRRRPLSRVFGTGFSNGGFMMGEIVAGAHAHASYFDAISPWGGHAYEVRGNATPTPIFMNHGEKDGVVRIAGCCPGARCCCGIDDWGGQCRPVQHLFDTWRRVNRCDAGLITLRDDADATCTTGTGCAANTTLCVHKRLAHEYPGVRFKATKYGGPTIEDTLEFFARVLPHERARR